MNTLIAVVIYPSLSFDLFFDDCMNGIKNQSHSDFTLYLFLDGIDETLIKKKLEIIELNCPIIIQKQTFGKLTPSEIRLAIIKFAQNNAYDFLCFADFDEQMTEKRIELSLLETCSYAFTYSDFCITNANLQVCETDFLKKRGIPSETLDFTQILDRNYIGLGVLTLNLSKIQSPFMVEIPKEIKAFDWFLATFLLLHNYYGKFVQKSLVYYRQHQETYVGSNYTLTPQKLSLGIFVKKHHYQYFSSHNSIFNERHYQLCELECFLKKNKENEQKYLRIINSYFNVKEMCWWENIKTLEEIRQWI